MSSTSPVAKRAKLDTPTIATHSGTFHADEALAVHLLTRLPEYKSATIVRSRDPAVLAAADVLVDVGAVYDPATHKYDHHQREFQDTFSPEHKTRLSSAGLIYKHFGKRVLAQLTGLGAETPANDTVYMKLYDDLIEAFDGIDNGVPRYPRDAKPAYRDSTSLSSVVSKLNPFDGEEGVTADGRFLEAVKLVGNHFDRCALYTAKAWLPARAVVRAALAARPSPGHVVVFDGFAPWKEHLRDLEQEANIDTSSIKAPLAEGAAVPTGVPLYCVFPDPSGSWRVQAVPLQPDSFENRKPLPAAWRGLRDGDLDKVTGVAGGVFIHASGFIGGHATREGALQLATMAASM